MRNIKTAGRQKDESVEDPYDLGLFDIGFPDKTGNIPAHCMWAHLPTQKLTFIAVRGYGQKQNEIDNAAAESDQRLVTPVNFFSLPASLPQFKAAPIL